jgi:hypothetical protein
MSGGRTSYSRSLVEGDVASIVATLSVGVTIRIAVYDEPLQGQDSAGFLFGVLTQELAPFELVEEIVEADKSVVVFETSFGAVRCGAVRAHGVSVVEYRPDGLVGELKVFLGPLTVLGLLTDVIGERMEQRFAAPKRRRH